MDKKVQNQTFYTLYDESEIPNNMKAIKCVFCFLSTREGKNEKWLDAYHDPVASIYTFTQCLTLSDIQADGDWKLIVADLGTGTYDMKLKVYKSK